MKKILLPLLFTFSSLFAFENLTDYNFYKKTEEGKVIINFYASWCNSCEIANKNLQAFKEKTKNDIKIYKVDISEQIQLTKKFDADMVPTFIYIQNGKILSKESGVKTIDQINDCAKKYFN